MKANRLISVILTVLFLFSSLSFTVNAYEDTLLVTFDAMELDYGADAAVSEEAAIEVFSESSSQLSGYDILSQMDNGDNLTKAYDLYLNGVEGFSSKIYLSYSGAYISPAEFQTVYNAVISDNPHIIWLSAKCSYAVNSAGTNVVYVLPTYIMTADEAETASAELSLAIENYTVGLEGKSDYKISKVLHDRLCLRTEYADTDNDQTAYGALVEKAAVCAGYARAYQMLLNACGIPCWTVVGTSIAPGSTTAVSHAWNMVFLDGCWYHTDVTWDDAGDTGISVFYSYFNVTTSQITEDHTVYSPFADLIPVCTATENNYFKIKGWECESYDRLTVIDSLKKGGGISKIYVTGDMDAFESALSEDLSVLAASIGMSGSITCYITVLGREFRLRLDGNLTANGDANGDLITDMKDILLIKRTLADMEEETELSTGNADMSDDSVISTADVLLLRKYLCGLA